VEGDGVVQRNNMLAGNSAGRLVLARSRRCLRLAAMQEQKGISLFDECKLRCRGHVVGTAEQAIHVHPVQNAALDNFLQTFTHPQAAGWAKINKFKAKVGDILLLPDSEGGLSCVLLGVGSSASDPWAYAALPGKLPPGIYTIAPDTLMDSCSATADSVLLGWVLGEPVGFWKLLSCLLQVSLVDRSDLATVAAVTWHRHDLLQVVTDIPGTKQAFWTRKWGTGARIAQQQLPTPMLLMMGSPFCLFPHRPIKR
jgi:hypothetical protein